MDFETIFKNILSDVKVGLSDEFDRNFERKAFFDRAWPARRNPDAKGSLMQVRGGSGLRGSINASIDGDNIAWRSSMPYAAIHNDGGEIQVTPQMKKFFWAMYYKASGAVSLKKDGTASKTQRNARLTLEAEYWKSLALIKVGTKIKMPQRRFIGNHPQVDATIKQVMDENMQEYQQHLQAAFDNKNNP